MNTKLNPLDADSWVTCPTHLITHLRNVPCKACKEERQEATIATLTAENAELRKALQDIVDNHLNFCMDSDSVDFYKKYTALLNKVQS